MRKSTQSQTSPSSLSAKVSAFFIMIAILLPLLLIQPLYKVSASNSLPIQPMPLVITAPPETFSFNNNQSIFNVTSTLATTLNTWLASFLATSPNAVEGFENGKNLVDYDSNSAIYSAATSETKFDFDGDGKADLARWQRSSGEWKVRKSSDNSIILTTLGSSSSIISPGKFDSDSITDYAVFNAGTWTIKQSSTNTTITISGFGSSGDKPVIGDYDGDGLADLAVFRASNSTWYIRQSSNNAVVSTQFGTTGDIPVAGNYDGDNQTDIAVFRPSTGDWHVIKSGSGYSAFHWGITSDIPVPADYDGDGKTDFAVFRVTTGTWYAYKSQLNDGSYFAQAWGNYGDQPVPADYDGDGKADFTVWRPTTGIWHSVKSSDLTYTYKTLGIAGDTAVESAYIKQVGSTVSAYDLSKARLLPINDTGGTNLYSRNFGWETGLAGLSGRGLSAGFGMSYNSLIWTKQGSNIFFDADNSNITPGFRFGFPTIEPSYFDTATGKFAFMMVSPSGGRTEFRQIAATDVYETADSSYTQLKFKGATSPNAVEDLSITVTGTDGTRMNFAWLAGAYRVSKITDANGNYITISHDEYGLLRTVTDTLNRVITVDYDAQFYPTTVKQTWQNGVHNYATFSYTTKEITTNFDTNLSVFGPPSGTVLKVLDKVTFADNSFVKFDYNAYGQVEQVNNHAQDGHKLNHVATNLSSVSGVQTDCPRFTETRSWVENFNGGAEVSIPNEFQTNQTYNLPDGGTATGNLIQITTPDGNGGSIISKTYTGSSGWKEGLPIATEDWVNGTKKRWTWTKYTQDNINLSYIQNPRVTESKIGDTENGNVRRTSVEYNNAAAALYGLPSDTFVYDSNQTTILKKSHTEYNLSTAYTSRRIIGLPSLSESYGYENGALPLISKTTYAYDEGNFSDTTLEQVITPIMHDTTKYGASFTTGRGNLTSVTRWDVTGATANITSNVKYNIAGSPVASIDPLNRTVKTSYLDKFEDGTPRNTFAYPTKLTDPNGNFSQVKYRYDIGANVWAKSPTVDGNAANSGKETVREFDTIGRPTKETLVNTGAYTRYEYPTNGVQSKFYSTITDTNGNGADVVDEVMSESWADGAGRVRRARTEHPNSTGGWMGSITEYNILGQVRRSTVPTEITVPNVNNPDTWAAAGDDQRGYNSSGQPIWLWMKHEYDWKGRPTKETNTDGTFKSFSYTGCGCAGGQVTTIEGEQLAEGRRTQKIYSDILGREYKSEVLDWQGNVYKTNLNFYDARDQIKVSREVAGIETSSDFRETTATFDGFGRLKTQHLPQQDTNKFTNYTYTNDGRPLTVTDGRGATKHFVYNNLAINKGSLHQIYWTVPQNSNIEIPATVTFDYNNLGMRTSMLDGFGSMSYEYSKLGQLNAETRTFNEAIPLTPVPNNNSFRIDYTYGLSGQLTSYKEPFGELVSYGFDKTSRLKTVTGNRTNEGGTQLNYVTDTKYRAWGTAKEIAYNNNDRIETMTYNHRLQIQSYGFSVGGYSTQLQYNYYDDGKLKGSNYLANINFSSSQVLPNLERKYEYDFAGRLVNGKTGAEARGQIETNAVNRPYRMTLNYNQYGDITNQQRLHYTSTFTSTFQYQNGRMSSQTQNQEIPGWVHKTNNSTNLFDADGRKTTEDSNEIYKYDAEGRMSTIIDPFANDDQQTDIKYDGDGRKIEKVTPRNCQGGVPCPIKEFFIVSSVIGDEVSKFSSELQRDTKIYAGGKEIAKRRMKFVGMPSIAQEITSLQISDSSGVENTDTVINISGPWDFTLWGDGNGTLDPFGAGVGYQNPYTVGPPRQQGDPNCVWTGGDGGGGGGQYPEQYDCGEPEGFDDQSDEDSETGSIPEDTCYDEFGKVHCNDFFDKFYGDDFIIVTKNGVLESRENPSKSSGGNDKKKKLLPPRLLKKQTKPLYIYDVDPITEESIPSFKVLSTTTFNFFKERINISPREKLSEFLAANTNCLDVLAKLAKQLDLSDYQDYITGINIHNADINPSNLSGQITTSEGDKMTLGDFLKEVYDSQGKSKPYAFTVYPNDQPTIYILSKGLSANNSSKAESWLKDGTSAGGTVFHETLHAYLFSIGKDSHEDIVKTLGINLIDVDKLKGKTDKYKDALRKNKNTLASESLDAWISRGCKN
jgi:YD repeat-containing protein